MAFKPGVAPSEITPENVYLNRRAFLKSVGLAAAALSGAARALAGRFDVDETKTPYEDVVHYNNFYEFGTDKSDPAREAHRLTTRPWTLRVEGECKKPKTFDVDELAKLFPAEERVYRFRCVEAWSMVVPWSGFELNRLLKKVEPTAKARHVAFTTVHRPAEMPGQKYPVLDWPYVEGLRMDEAMHPLTLLVTGLYGKPLPNQDGAPIRLIVPWKYGFKSIKSVVRLRLVYSPPPTSWNRAAPDEYGFYSNVNPEVDHPRWSQARERRLGELFKRETLPFNGYAAQVAGLYKGMDLKVYR